jgi:hypothetical protein
VALGVDDPQAYLSLAALLWNQQRLEDAAAIYALGLEAFPGHAELAKWLSRAEQRLGP